MSDMNSVKMDFFNIPHDIKHDHSAEGTQRLREGIKKITELMGGEHERCIEHVVLYAELNVRYFFLAHIVDKEILKHAFELFMNNMVMMFVKNLTMAETK